MTKNEYKEAHKRLRKAVATFNKNPACQLARYQPNQIYDEYKAAFAAVYHPKEKDTP